MFVLQVSAKLYVESLTGASGMLLATHSPRHALTFRTRATAEEFMNANAAALPTGTRAVPTTERAMQRQENLEKR